MTPQKVADYLGRDDPKTVALAGAHLPITTAFVNAYTRGNGFDPVDGLPNPELEAVIIAVTARSVTNPEQLQDSAIADVSETFAPQGFTLPELFVLNRYRKRSQL